MWLFKRKEGFTDEEREVLLQRPVCLFCGAYHLHECKRVAEVSYGPGGSVAHVKFFAKWDHSDTIWKHDLEEVPVLPLRVRAGTKVIKAFNVIRTHVADSFWTVSYKSWLARIIIFAAGVFATLAIVLGFTLLTIEMVKVAIHAA